jgi:peptide methionine sulfoxide reductase MsrB
MIKTEFLGFRATPTERAAIERLRAACGLPSLSEAIRRAVVNAERDLSDPRQRAMTNVGEVHGGDQA